MRHVTPPMFRDRFAVAGAVIAAYRGGLRRPSPSVTLVGAALAVLLGLPGDGAGDPPTQYRAEQTTQIGVMSVASRIYVKGELTRSEARQGGQDVVTIQRRDKGRVWVLWPGMRVFVDQPIPPPDPKHERHPDAMEVREAAGREWIGAQETEKLKVTSKNQFGETIVSWEWRAPDLGGLVIRRKSALGQVDLRNVITGPQPASLFEVPSGYRQLSFGAPAAPTGPVAPAPHPPSAEPPRREAPPLPTGRP